MFDRIVLYATSHTLSVGLWRWGKLRWHGEFAKDEAGRRQFRQFLEAHAKTAVCMLADTVEEDYRLETLPHVRGSTRRALLARKLEQHYRHTPFRAACFVGRDQQHDRRSDRYLFAALSASVCLQDWLEIMAAHHTRLQGVYLMPMLSEELVRRLQFARPHLLINERLGSGLRQSYLQQGRLLFSRLVLMPPLAQPEVAIFLADETEKVRLYLVSQRLIEPDTVLGLLRPTMGEGGEGDVDEMGPKQLPSYSQDMAKLARKLGLDPQWLSAHPELLHMHVLARGGAIAADLAPAALTRTYRLGKLQWRLRMFTAAVVLAALAFSVFNWRQGQELELQRLQAWQATQRQQALEHRLPQNSAATSVTGADMQRAVTLRMALDRYPHSPRRMMNVLGAALAFTPEIRIDRLRWMLSENLSPADQNQSVQSVQSVLHGSPGVLYELGFVSGVATGFAGDYQAAGASIERLAGQLRAQSAVAEVVVLQAPTDLSTGIGLNGSTDSTSEPSQEAAFKLKLILKREAS